MAWLVTTEVNEYGQMGEYFICMFKEKPSLEEFSRCLEPLPYRDSIEHWYAGKGRYKSEYQWYWLKEYSLL